LVHILVLLGTRKTGQLSKFLNHTLATHKQVDSFFENINYNDGKGAFTLTLFEMTITDCPCPSLYHLTHLNCKTTHYDPISQFSFPRLFQNADLLSANCFLHILTNVEHQTEAQFLFH
jgi:hypothetical protein